MSTTTLHPVAVAYLQRVRREGRDLPGDRLDELVTDLEEHLSTAIPGDASDDEARLLLSRFGDPHEIIEAERPEPTGSAERRGAREWVAVFLLLFGFLALGVGWFVGVFLLWSSRAWTTKDKLIGTFVLPGGLSATAVILVLALGRPTKQTCISLGGRVVHCTHATSTGPSTLGSIALILLALTPIATAVYLARRAR